MGALKEVQGCILFFETTGTGGKNSMNSLRGGISIGRASIIWYRRRGFKSRSPFPARVDPTLVWTSRKRLRQSSICGLTPIICNIWRLSLREILYREDQVQILDGTDRRGHFPAQNLYRSLNGTVYLVRWVKAYTPLNSTVNCERLPGSYLVGSQ